MAQRMYTKAEAELRVKLQRCYVQNTKLKLKVAELELRIAEREAD